MCNGNDLELAGWIDYIYMGHGARLVMLTGAARSTFFTQRMILSCYCVKANEWFFFRVVNHSGLPLATQWFGHNPLVLQAAPQLCL